MQIRTGSIVRKAIFIAFLVLLTGFSSDIIAQDGAEESVSRQRQINQPEDRAGRHKRPQVGNNRVRTIDGSGNNLDDTEMGASFIELLRIVDPYYGDGISTLAGEGRPSARAVSNAVSLQEVSIPNTLGASDFLWQWGQFVDHDIDLTEGTDPPESANIEVPRGDPFFDPDGTGTEVIELNRSIYNESSGTGTDNPRQQLNEISAWIDASNVYGSVKPPR